jgi:polyisoprenoid-binding protein YceI
MTRWIVDSEYSRVLFTVKYLLFARLSGQFDKITGAADFDPDDLPHASIDVVIDVASIVTGDQARDDYLRGPDFFDAERYPAITFKSTSVEALGNGRTRITGDLTIHGATRKAVLETEHAYPGDESYDEGMSMQFTARTIINREDYGIVLDGVTEKADALVSKEIQIILDVRLVLQDLLKVK